ncbi:SGNH/GDSL hydrolase family protein [Pseudoduganella sp. GCM10020061]|uniref:SGNH/GDSL hydrolase family protein n=1 Tax=Pseudoduganella sp. GCM10020061 TaxID=3317345 RepID=UPI003624D735
MRQSNYVLALVAAAVLAGCGDSGSGPASTLLSKAQKPVFARQVVFGDSLADVGSYKVGPIAAAGGGKFTVNGVVAGKPELDGRTWSEWLAATMGMSAPCAAQTGLNGQGMFAVPVQNHLNCYNYAQGGARVTNPVGPGNALTGDPTGALTVPVVTQVATHLARNGGKFGGNEVVYVMAGGNDLLMLMGQLAAAATAAGTSAGQTAFGQSLVTQLAAGAPNPQSAAVAIATAMQTERARPGSTDQTVVGAAVTAAVMAGNTAAGSPAVYGPMVATATAAGQAAGAKAGQDYLTANGPNNVPAMGAAGAELANIINTQILGKGAKYVVVNNLPDVSVSPSARSQSASAQQLIKGMATSFNTALRANLPDDARVLYVDLFALSNDQFANPSKYGLTNTTAVACGPNAGGTSSLMCNGTNLVAGDVSRYMFADSVHPTPYEHSLVARYIADQMFTKGWL